MISTEDFSNMSVFGEGVFDFIWWGCEGKSDKKKSVIVYTLVSFMCTVPY